MVEESKHSYRPVSDAPAEPSTSVPCAMSEPSEAGAAHQLLADQTAVVGRAVQPGLSGCARTRKCALGGLVLVVAVAGVCAALATITTQGRHDAPHSLVDGYMGHNIIVIPTQNKSVKVGVVELKTVHHEEVEVDELQVTSGDDLDRNLTLEEQQELAIELTAYWDAGKCGPRGADYNTEWCEGGTKDWVNPRCRPGIEVNYTLCYSGYAHLVSVRTAWREWYGSITPVQVNGCAYFYYAQYMCADTTTTTTTTTSSTTTTTTTTTETTSTTTTTSTSKETEKLFEGYLHDFEVGLAKELHAGPAKHRHGICMAVDEDGNVHMAGCKKDTDQHWDYDGADGSIRPAGGGQCLSAVAGAGSQVALRPCNAMDAKQTWFYDGRPGTAANGEGMCLDVDVPSEVGRQVKVWNCEAGNEHQQWDFESAQCSTVKHRQHGICLDAQDRCEPKGSVHLWDCLVQNPNQLWEYHAPSGALKSHYGICLGAVDRDVADGYVNMTRCDPRRSGQQWHHSKETGLIRNLEVKMCLLAPHPTEKDSRLYLADCDKDDALQQWDLEDSSCYAKDAGHCTKCSNTFVAPKPGQWANDLNGVTVPDVCFMSPGVHSVFVIGDWGGIVKGAVVKPADHRDPEKFPGSQRNFVNGVDDQAQQRVAQQMEIRAQTSHPDYLLNVGDNFYWAGVPGHCGNPVTSLQPKTMAQFENGFEKVYNGPSLAGKPWLGVLGNHDYGGWMFDAAWDQAIAYTWAPSGRWMTPAQYWKTKVHYEDFSVEYFFVDSNFFDAGPMAANPGHNVCNNVHNKDDATCGAEGPVNLGACPGWFNSLWAQQQKWLEEVLSKSSADWQVVVTHFPPLWGIGYWPDMAYRHGIDLFVSGHEHDLQVHYREDGNFLAPSAWVVSGGGGGITSEATPSPDGQDDQYGFIELKFSRIRIEINAISHGGSIRYTEYVHQRHRMMNASVW
eukprot:CAMPEP_0195058932 /NCGR_PEP_ID=MMETSP0448-20130528/6558_1 /TAXON_ID=66468 /ORGANISM="Heterocapsa triquestra, Strain CCMP 448" /LENGTH=951 /DNA_ID=CAMNT_0040089119 /DNA_START=49 /DNA_END=2901 /DNA_ORIENTATION=-